MLERQELLDSVHKGIEKSCEILIFSSFFLEYLFKYFSFFNILCDPVVKNKIDNIKEK